MRSLLLVGLAGALSLPALAQQGDAENVARAARQSDTLALLNQQIPEVALDGAPLEVVVDWVREFTKLNVDVRWESLEFAGVDRDKPISIRARNLRLSQVLWMILNQAGGADVKLAYRASGNLLVISTADELGREMVSKVYDVADLLVRMPNFYNAVELDVVQALQSVGQTGQGGDIFNPERGIEEPRQWDGNIPPDTQLLVNVIRNAVEPDSWDVNGGEGTISPFRRQIVVRNSILVHQRLGGFIEE